MKAIIIDDEKRARLLLKALLTDYCQDVQVLGDFSDLESGVEAIKRIQPELVFLDIELPESSGLQILDFFKESELNFSIIFVTAYSEYAIQAFKLSAIDYVLKPINTDKLIEAVSHYKNHKSKQVRQLEALKSNLYETKKKIVIPSRDDFQYLDPEDVIYIKAEGSYCQFHLRNGKRILMSRNLKFVEEMIQPFPFLQRVHKSFIVNCNEIAFYSRGSGKLQLKDGTELQATGEKMEALGLK
ncbi:MAG: LytR/AlgR family response regulator transcription factor [Fluviicola sp.]